MEICQIEKTMIYNEHKKRKITHNRFTIKVRLKRLCSLHPTLLIGAFLSFYIGCVTCNRPPRFLIDGQTEIVLRLKEGDDTPIGNCYSSTFPLYQSPFYLRYLNL